MKEKTKWNQFIVDFHLFIHSDAWNFWEGLIWNFFRWRQKWRARKTAWGREGGRFVQNFMSTIPCLLSNWEWHKFRPSHALLPSCHCFYSVIWRKGEGGGVIWWWGLGPYYFEFGPITEIIQLRIEILKSEIIQFPCYFT